MENDKNERVIHDNRGKFAKGNCANPKGRPKNAEPELLRQALEKQGIKKGINFWDKVAEYAFRDRNVMIAVMKKFIPDVQKIEGVASQFVVYFDRKNGLCSEAEAKDISSVRK